MLFIPPSQVSLGCLHWAKSLQSIMNETQTTNEHIRKLLAKLIDTLGEILWITFVSPYCADHSQGF